MRLKALAVSLVAAFAVTTAPVVSAAAPVTGGTVVYLSSKIPSLNPLHSAYEVGLVTSQIFASLTRMNEKNEISPYIAESWTCLLYTSPSPRDATLSRMPSSA